jgi:hypothetical protein
MRFTLLSLLPVALAGLVFQAPAADATPSAGPQRGSQVQYTSIVSLAHVQAEIIPVRIDVQFNGEERTRIVEAIRHWNHVLNGQARFEIGQDHNVNASSGPKQPNTWIVVRVSGTGFSPIPGRGPQLGTLAQAQTLVEGGMVSVFADKIGQRDLAQIMLHELGHVLGLGHENAGRLMAPQYSTGAQQCIDKGAVQAVARQKNLAFYALNWCGEPGAVTQANHGQLAVRHTP